VVIVATEEALAAVPGSMREGSYACGASKWQTIRRIVLPRAMPGIMTGMILAMARGAGRGGAADAGRRGQAGARAADRRHLPLPPPERSFMHLGFHIYDLGFQSQNSEAAKPMVFTTTLLLIAMIAAAERHGDLAAHPAAAAVRDGAVLRRGEPCHDLHRPIPAAAPGETRGPAPEPPTGRPGSRHRRRRAVARRDARRELAARTPCWRWTTSTSGTAKAGAVRHQHEHARGQGHGADRPLGLRQVHAAALGQPHQRPDRHVRIEGDMRLNGDSIYGPGST
jgi:hypothetical protein